MFKRKFVPIWIAIVVWIAWAYGMHTGDRWHLFSTHYFMSLTMALGSFIAGATSEGGGAVAFPVMTLGFKISPDVARDFSLLIQSVGMIAAAATILFTRIPVLGTAVVWSSVGGAIGIGIGFELLARWPLPPVYAKMLFTSVWLSFAFALYWINRYHDREVHECIECFSGRHIVMLGGVGILGGMVSSITGSGLDILTFSLLVLRFRISEKIATPTSVVLMGINALVGSLYKGGVMNTLASEAWDYWWVCVPIVCVGAPLGAWFIRNRSRLFVAAILYFSIAVQFVAALIILPLTPKLVTFAVIVFSLGLLLFYRMSKLGIRRMEWLAGEPEPPRSSG